MGLFEGVFAGEMERFWGLGGWMEEKVEMGYLVYVC